MPHELIDPQAERKAVARGSASEPEPGKAHALFMLGCALTNLQTARDHLAHMGWTFAIGKTQQDLTRLIAKIEG